MIKTALVTGSTSGIGKAFAEKLASEGCRLLLVSRDASKLSEQAAYLARTYNIKASCVPLDLSLPGAAQKVYDAVRELGLSVQILISNAGFNEAGAFLDTDMKKEREMIQLHAIFTTELMKLFVPDMVRDGYGRILNLGSTGSFMPIPYDAVYAATKAYILSVSRAIHAELAGSGVSITTLCPGATNTEFARKSGLENTLLFKLFVMEPARVAEIGYHALMNRRATVIAGTYNKLLVFSSKFVPLFILNPITMKMLKRGTLHK